MAQPRPGSYEEFYQKTLGKPPAPRIQPGEIPRQLGQGKSRGWQMLLGAIQRLLTGRP